MDFVPRRFLRCHSKSDRDSADVSTQVWQAVFQPSKNSYLVATCGGNKVCVIDVKTGQVQYRYTFPKGLLYTLSWGEVSKDKYILATAGTNNIIVFIDLSTESAYLKYSVLQKKKCFISSILFHPYEKRLFCALNSGLLYVFGFEIEENRVVNIEQSCVVDLEVEIFGLAFCKFTDCLLVATNAGLMGWNKYNSKRNDRDFIVFELPENPNDLYKEQNEKVIDSIEIIKDGWIVTKVALHGVLYIFNLFTALSNVKNNKSTVKPSYVLKWSDTDNYFMNCGVGFDGKLLACGDDKGSIWIYNLEDMNFKSSSDGTTKNVEAHAVLKWPKLLDSYLKKQKKLDVDVYDIVVARCAVHSKGKYLVAVTNNNFVCLYSLSTLK